MSDVKPNQPLDPSGAHGFRKLSLTRRLLALTIAFVLVAEFLIYLPSLANYRRTWLQNKIDSAYLTVLLAGAVPGFLIDDATRRELLESAGVQAIMINRDGNEILSMAREDFVDRDYAYDLRETGIFRSIPTAINGLLGHNRVIDVTGVSPNPVIVVTVRIDEGPLTQALWDYSARITFLSLFISVFVAGGLFLVLRRGIIQPVQRITRAITRFRQDPEKSSESWQPSGELDEIGIAEQELWIMQEDLRRALKQQEHLAAMGTAVAKISHDLRNILATAQLLSDYLVTSADPEVRRIAPRVIASLDRALKLCTDTMRYGRAQEAVPNKEVTGLAELVREVAATSGAAPIGQIVVDIDVDVGLTVLVDRDQMFRALLNILRNALQALGVNGTCRVTARVDQKNLWIDVVDNGPGLSARAQENLFRPFNAAAKGTGLGLVIARDLVRLQGGDLEMVSTGPTGTTFRIILENAVVPG